MLKKELAVLLALTILSGSMQVGIDAKEREGGGS